MNVRIISPDTINSVSASAICPTTSASRVRWRAAFFERGQSWFSESDDGERTAERAAQRRDRQREQQHQPIDADIVDTWQFRGRDAAQQSDGRLREQQAE